MNPPYWFFGARLRILADGPQTESRYDLIEGDFPAGTETPLHLHTKYDELIYVREGEFTVYTDAGTVVLAPGESVFVPQVFLVFKVHVQASLRQLGHLQDVAQRSAGHAFRIEQRGGFFNDQLPGSFCLCHTG